MKTTTHKVTWFLNRVILWGYMTYSGPNLDHLYIWQLDAASFCKNYAKLYFDAKLLEMGLNRGGEIFGAPFFKKSVLMANIWWCC